MTDYELTYEEWCKKVNRILVSKVGMEMDDMCDGPSWDRWSDELTPMEYIEELMLDWNDMDRAEFDLIFGGS